MSSCDFRYGPDTSDSDRGALRLRPFSALSRVEFFCGLLVLVVDFLFKMAECVDFGVVEVESSVVEENIGNTLTNHAVHVDITKHKLRHGN